MLTTDEVWEITRNFSMKRTECNLRLPNVLLKELAEIAKERNLETVNQLIEDLLYAYIKKATLRRHKAKANETAPNGLTNWLENSNAEN